MSLWTMPALVSAVVGNFAACLDRRTGERFWSVFFGVLMCREKRRTASAWFRAAGIGADFRRPFSPPEIGNALPVRNACGFEDVTTAITLRITKSKVRVFRLSSTGSVQAPS